MNTKNAMLPAVSHRCITSWKPKRSGVVAITGHSVSSQIAPKVYAAAPSHIQFIARQPTMR